MNIFKIILNIIIIALFGIFIISQVNAMEIDNVKSYNPSTETVTIKNSILGIPTTEIATLKLITPHHNIVWGTGYQRVAEIEIDNKGEYTDALKKVDFYRSYFGTVKQIEYFDYRYKTTKTITEDIIGCPNRNLQPGEICKFEKIGEQERIVDDWVLLDATKPLPEGKITIGLYYSNVKIGEVIEWIPTFFGLEISEWATFEGATMIETFGASGDTYYPITTSRHGGQTFTVGYQTASPPLSLVGVAMSVKKSGSPGLATFSIYAVNASNLPTGSALSQNTTVNADNFDTNYRWENVTMPSFTFTDNTKYAVIIEQTSAAEIDYFVRGAGNGYNAGICIDYSGTFPFGCGAYPNNSTAIDAYFSIYTMAAAYNESLTTSLIVPVNGFNTTNTNITFNATSTPLNINLTNATLYLWNSTGININQSTLTLSGNSANTSSFNLSGLYSDVYKWNVLSCGINSTLATRCSFASNNFTLNIDREPPIITILYPPNNTNFSSFGSLTFELNTSVVHEGYKGCWYYNGTGNTTITCGTNTTINFTTSQAGNRQVIFYANDSTNNIASNILNIFYNYVIPYINYTQAVIEKQNTTISLNITATRILNTYANITWNNTVYTMNLISNNGTFAQFLRTITTPEVGANANIYSYINYSIDGAILNSSLLNQTIYNIPPLIVDSTCTSPVYTFNLVDEEGLGDIAGNIEYNFYYGLSNSTMVRTYGRLINNQTFNLCINSTLSTDWVLGSGEIFYNNETAVDRRYYLFDNTPISNNTLRNITLHDLQTSLQTSFKLEVEDTSLNPYKNVITTLVRWYSGSNEYRVVDMAKTDETGSTVMHVKTEDIDYKIGVYYTNGTLIKLAAPARLVCLSSPCTYTLKISPGEIDYTSFLNLQYSLNYNTSTGVWSFIFSDTTQKTDTINLTIWKLTSTSENLICSNYTNAYIGQLTCNTSIYTGTLKAKVTREASPPVIVTQKLIEVIGRAFNTPLGLFLWIFLAIPIIVTMAAISPIIAIIGGIIAFIPALYFNMVTITIIGGFSILGGLIAHFLKRIN